ncbi:MAG: hypothetical protein LBR10_09990 [Prevotellaceae bacterium]|jgi:hypothetical protein|nr:hypothetical protein [Prevotellaceae bacterium]
MEKSELIKTIGELQEVLKDHNKFIHLFSADEGKKTLTKIFSLTVDVQRLLAASDVKDVVYPKNLHLERGKAGFVRIRPCGEEYGNKTYLGILIGEMACGITSKIEANKMELSWSAYNPAIFVPALNKIIFGGEGWWSEIEGSDDLKEISNLEIDNTWYMKLLKLMGAEK